MRDPQWARAQAAMVEVIGYPSTGSCFCETNTPTFDGLTSAVYECVASDAVADRIGGADG